MTFQNYINGEWVSGETFENRNPANTDEVVGEFVKGRAADVQAAAEAAQAAFPALHYCRTQTRSPGWRRWRTVS